MKFFVPSACDENNAEMIYSAIAEFNSAPALVMRIFKLKWRHGEEEMSGEVGKAAPPYYGTRDEPILAILDCGNLFKVCTPSRGGVTGEAILVGKNLNSRVSYFE